MLDWEGCGRVVQIPILCTSAFAVWSTAYHTALTWSFRFHFPLSLLGFLKFSQTRNEWRSLPWVSNVLSQAPRMAIFGSNETLYLGSVLSIIYWLRASWESLVNTGERMRGTKYLTSSSAQIFNLSRYCKDKSEKADRIEKLKKTINSFLITDNWEAEEARMHPARKASFLFLMIFN